MAGIPLLDHLQGCSFARLVDEPDQPWKTAAFSQFPCPALREWAAMPLSDGMRETFFGPLIRDVEAQLAKESPRYSRELYENHVMGYTMRTDRYRLVLWVDYRAPREEPIAVELYDHENDPKENTNARVWGGPSTERRRAPFWSMEMRSDEHMRVQDAEQPALGWPCGHNTVRRESQRFSAGTNPARPIGRSIISSGGSFEE